MTSCAAVSVALLLLALLPLPVCGGTPPDTAQRLTKQGRLCMDPVFIKGGAELIYTVQETPTQFALMKLTLADGKIERLHPQATTSEFEATFSPDGRYYAFIQSRGNLNLKLLIRDTRLDRTSTFDPGGGFASIRRPSLAPNGSRVLFSIPTPTGQQIAEVTGTGTDRKLLTQTGINNWPAFSPDGKRIALASSRDGDFEIYVMNADGANAQRLTRSPGLDVRPSWSPDGKRIAFTSNRDGNYEIYVMNADGSKVVRATHNPERDDYPCWHPDGQRLVLVSERQGRSDLYLIPAPQ